MTGVKNIDKMEWHTADMVTVSDENLGDGLKEELIQA